MARGRPPSSKTLVDRQLGRNVGKSVLPAEDTYRVPNHSGDHSEGRVDRTPTQDLDMVNKKYVDDQDGNHVLKAGDTMTGNLSIVHATNPTIATTDTTNTVSAFMQGGNTQGFIGTQTNHPFIIMSNLTEAIEIDTSQNATFAANINGSNVTTGENPGHTHTGSSLSGITTADVEAELKTGGNGFYIKKPTSSDDFNIFYTPIAITITSVTGVTDTGTVTLQLKHKSNTDPAAAGTSILTSNMVADTTPGETTTSFADATIPADSWIAYTSSASTSSPVELWITIKWTID